MYHDLWHNKEPVLSLDFHPSGRLATGGADNTIKIWKLSQDGSKAEFLSNLSRHQGAVNIVRFSPDGKFLASGSDDGTIFIWKLDDTKDPLNTSTFGEEDYMNKEVWTVHTSLMGSSKDVYSLDWSANSNELISGSTDCGVYLWSVTQEKKLQEFHEHDHYVQGVLFDPHNVFCVSQSQDKSARVYKKKKNSDKMYCAHHIRKRIGNDETVEKTGIADGNMTEKPFSHNMFVDESISAFFRRPSWSTDGNFLFLPTGVYKKDKESEAFYVTYVFNRSSFQIPVACIPTKKPSLLVRFSPKLYRLRGTQDADPFLNLEYRMIYAIASGSTITVYDTQRLHPIAHFDNLHFATHTDLAWSKDGRVLAISSMDGYVSLITFEELGDPLEPEEEMKILPQTTSDQEISAQQIQKTNKMDEEVPIFTPQIKRITPSNV